MKIQQLHPETGKMLKIKIGTIKSNAPKATTPKSGIRVDRCNKHNYRTISRTNRVNHGTIFKNLPKHFPLEVTVKIRLHIGSY